MIMRYYNDHYILFGGIRTKNIYFCCMTIRNYHKENALIVCITISTNIMIPTRQKNNYNTNPNRALYDDISNSYSIQIYF